MRAFSVISRDFSKTGSSNGPEVVAGAFIPNHPGKFQHLSVSSALKHLLKMPATSEIHTEEAHRGCRKEEETQTAAEKKNFGVFCDERGYLDQVEYIMQHGRRKGDRTGTGVVSVFGAQARYSLRGLTLLTYKNYNMSL